MTLETAQKHWITDENGNRASIEAWGSEEAARKALGSLVGCRGCVDCVDCEYCVDCEDCVECVRSSFCARCYLCYRSSRCSYCVDCVGLSGCSRSSRCSGCIDCVGCIGCVDCHSCARCDGCFRATGASGRVYIAPRMAIPRIENIHEAVYAAVKSPGALDMDNWHRRCDTTHCRAGWVIHLAGDAGYALERRTTPVWAAMQIYKASGYDISPARFFDGNEKAMADMKRLASA